MRYRAVAALSLIIFHSACGSDSSTGTSSTPPATTCTVSSVSVSASSTTVAQGAPSNLTATVSATQSCTGGVTWSTTGGTVVGNGLTATFASTTPGTFVVTATSMADATKSGSVSITVTAPVLACGTANGTTVAHTANINANETWAGDGVTHVVTNDITIGSNAVVTVQPCAIVSLGNTTNINVNGTAHFVAAGTSATRFVLFKRNNANQAWGTIRGVSGTSLIDFTWTTLQGGGNFGGMNNPTIAASGNGYSSVPAPVIRVNNVTIQGSQGGGVYLDGNAGFTSDSHLLTITGSGDRPVNTTMMSLGTLPDGSYTGNANNEILIFGPNANVFADMTVGDFGVPIRVPYGGMNIAPPGGTAGTVTLTVKPGVVFKFPKLPPNQPGARVTFGGNGNAPNNPVGVLNAIGTPSDPIIFTSGETNPAPGDWIGIWLNTATGSRLDYVEISYAGAASGVVSASCKPANTSDQAALLVGDFSTQYVPPSNLITNSKLTNSAGYGINAMWQANIFNSVDLTQTNTFTNNARCKQTYNGLTSGVCPVGGGCTVP